jgi:hypothetical protein
VPLTLCLMAGTLAVTRLPEDAAYPDWAHGELVSVTRTADEVSVVSAAAGVPNSVPSDRGWRAFRVEGQLALDLTGIAAALTAPLAAARIAVFVLSTYDTDYLLVREHEVTRAAAALSEAGFEIAS